MHCTYYCSQMRFKKKKKGWVQAPIIPEIIQFSCYNNFIFLQWSHEQNSHNLNVKVKLVSVSTNVYTCRNHFNANIQLIQLSVHHFNVAQPQQCSLFHDRLLPLPCNQVVASETSRKASSSCVAKKKKKSSMEKLCLMWTYMLIKACLALFRAGVWHIQCSPEWGKVRMQQLDGSWCKELQVSEPKLTPAPLLYRLSLQCYPTCHSWLKNLSSHLYWR